MRPAVNPIISLGLTVRRWIVPDAHGHGWMPLAYLGYLVFLFVPLFVRVLPANMGARTPIHLGATLGSIVVFLPLYVLVWRGGLRRQLAAICLIFLMGCVLFLHNPYANTYVIYAASMAGVLALPLTRLWLLVAAMLATFIAWMWMVQVPGGLLLFVAGITASIGISAFLGTYFHIERERKRAELRLSQEEVRRVAAYAERERIGRDLHDLLGHTLSMIALKAELAGKLARRDPVAARGEIDDVARIAREALAQIRTAVSGIRSAVLAAEAASARVLLESDGIAMQAELAQLPLSREAESALALALREAVTNVQRHARARRVTLSLHSDDHHALLRITDDGRGGSLQPGHGLSGMRERLERIGGTLRVGAGPDGRGTLLEARVPLQVPA